MRHMYVHKNYVHKQLCLHEILSWLRVLPILGLHFAYLFVWNNYVTCWPSGDLDKLKTQAWCNFEFLLARLHSSSANALINDLSLTSASALDPDIHLVLHTVIASVRVLTVDSLQLANELIGRLRPLKGHVTHDVILTMCIRNLLAMWLVTDLFQSLLLVSGMFTFLTFLQCTAVIDELSNISQVTLKFLILVSYRCLQT